MTTHLHTQAKTMNKTRIWYQNLPYLRVLDGCRTFLRHIFGPYISVHLRNLFVSHIAVPVKSDIKKSCQQHIQVRCPWTYEINHWKCLLLLIGRFRIGYATFRWVPKMYFRFPRHHVSISGRDVTEICTAINSARSPWQCLKSAWPYLLEFWRYRGTSGLGGILPPAAGIRVKTKIDRRRLTKDSLSCVHAWCGFVINTLRKKTFSTGAVRKNDEYCALCSSATATAAVAIGQLQHQLSHYSLVALQAFCFPKSDFWGASRGPRPKNFLGSLSLAIFSGPFINNATIRPLSGNCNWSWVSVL